MGTQCDNAKVGRSAAKFNLREASDSFQDDVELSSLAGADGNACGLLRQKTQRKRFQGILQQSRNNLIAAIGPQIYRIQLLLFYFPLYLLHVLDSSPELSYSVSTPLSNTCSFKHVLCSLHIRCFLLFYRQSKIVAQNVTKIICLKFLNCSQKGGGGCEC